MLCKSTKIRGYNILFMKKNVTLHLGKYKVINLKTMNKIELLSPAKNLQYGKEAIGHGADAVYIGAPQFGARVAAANSISDVSELVNYAHIYGAKVYVALNTLLFDNELADAQAMIHSLYNIGVDALIVQDMGILEMDLPPIELHASTQTHNVDVDRIAFLEKVGFSRIILGRELSLEQITTIRQSTNNVELEAFVQGALCVCYSGQCYLSQSINEHSGNRGCCSQPCRSVYNMYNADGVLLRRNEHLLSLKDFSAEHHLREMMERGISSFKIEGRLKDISYVKNVTGYYRRLIDDILLGRKDYAQASSGTTKLYFTPDLERTFNRGFTDYFLCERQPMASFLTQKSLGKQVARVVKADRNTMVIDGDIALTAGDGLCFFNDRNELEGCMVNRVEGKKVWLNKTVTIERNTILYRNNDYAFEKTLQSKSAERRIGVSLLFEETSNGFALTITDDDGVFATESITIEKALAENVDKSREQISKQLSKMGDTPFEVKDIIINCSNTYFIPASVLNDIRRRAVGKLVEMRVRQNKSKPSVFYPNDVPYHKTEVSYRENVVNRLSERFYTRHGATVLEHGVELTKKYSDKALMTTKYCIRYEIGQCLKRNNVDKEYAQNLYLENNRKVYRLQFNCNECEMQIFAIDGLPKNVKR